MADNTQQRSRPPPNRRRDKVQLSCGPCRQRKLRCDRHQPCGACSRRGVTNSCNYATRCSASISTSSTATINSSGKPDARRSAAPRPSTNSSLHGRISELESLVMTLMQGQQDQPVPSPAPTPTSQRAPRSLSLSPSAQPAQPARVLPEIRRPTKSQDLVEQADPGNLKVHESGTCYIQSVHWEAILTKIRGLKEDLGTDTTTHTPRSSGSHLFYGPNRHASRDEILAAVPPRPVVDRLMAVHFDSYIITPYFLHSKKFLREYEAFWQDQSATSIAWIGLMFSMIYIAAQLQAFTIDVTDGRAESLKAEYLTMKDAFREKAVQCLILARYTVGGPYILETLVTVLAGEFVLLKEGGSDGSLLISMILHLAMRMGYHRDPDHFPGISPFEAEMRRRVWTTILHMDLFLSLEMGLPRSATDTHIDTKPPRNLADCDYDEDTTEMPAARPETEWTPVLALIARGRLVRALGLICDINTDINPPSYDEVVKVDALLADVRDRATPPPLRWESMQHPITDSPSLMIQRVNLETTYHKSRILLYRRALINCPARRVSKKESQSVRICLESALKILSLQEMLHEESQPFGRLCQLKWKISRIFNQDCLLATSLLCLYLQDVDEFEFPESAEPSSPPPPRTEEIRQRLITSYHIWFQWSAISAEAGKVAKALSIVLGNTDTDTKASSAQIEDEDETGDDRSTGNGPPPAYDFLTDFDATGTMHLNEFGTTAFSNQYFPSGFYSPLTFFDNVLGSQGI